MVVYKITNTINNKVYIGQTKKSIKRRFSEHCRQTVCKKLSRAIKKYGKDNFIIEILEENNNQEVIDKLEEKYIKEYNSILNGYNILSGKHYKLNNKQKQQRIKVLESNRRKTPIIIHNTITKLEKDFDTIYAAARELNCNPARLFNALKSENKRYKNYIVRKKGEEFSTKFELNSFRSPPVIGFDFDNNRIYVYTKLSNCEKDSFCSMHIRKCCRGEKETYKGITWCYIHEILPLFKRDGILT